MWPFAEQPNVEIQLTADVSLHHEDGNAGCLTADCYQVTDLFEEQISAAAYGDE